MGMGQAGRSSELVEAAGGEDRDDCVLRCTLCPGLGSHYLQQTLGISPGEDIVPSQHYPRGNVQCLQGLELNWCAFRRLFYT